MSSYFGDILGKSLNIFSFYLGQFVISGIQLVIYDARSSVAGIWLAISAAICHISIRYVQSSYPELCGWYLAGNLCQS